MDDDGIAIEIKKRFDSLTEGKQRRFIRFLEGLQTVDLQRPGGSK